jgi:hypothetical protein
MKVEHLKKFVGLTVIVQLKEAMAIGTAAGNARLVPECNEKGEMLKKDGGVANNSTRPDELAVRPAWPIKVQRDEGNRPEFRFAIEDAILGIEDQARELPYGAATEGDSVVHLMYRQQGALMELTVTPDQILGITVVRSGPVEEQESRIVKPS